jgi:hypothetical protein
MSYEMLPDEVIRLPDIDRTHLPRFSSADGRFLQKFEDVREFLGALAGFVRRFVGKVGEDRCRAARRPAGLVYVLESRTEYLPTAMIE